jgi:uncharacterized repeat protein (TIGR01451 family)
MRYWWVRLPGAALLALSLLTAPGALTVQPVAAQDADVRISISAQNLARLEAGTGRPAVGSIPDPGSARREIATSTVEPAGTVTYTMTVTNGPVAVPGVTARVSLNSGRLVSANLDGSGFTGETFFLGGGSSAATREAVWRRDSQFAAGANARFTVVAQAPDQPGTLTATATVALTTSLPESNRANNAASVTTQVVLPPDLALSVQASPNPVPAGERLTYALTVTNRGERAASGVVVTNTLPAGVDYVSATGTRGFTCSRDGRSVRCSGATIPRGETAQLTILVGVPATVPSGQQLDFEGVVEDGATGLVSRVNNLAGAITTVGGAPDLAVSIDAPIRCATGPGSGCGADAPLPTWVVPVTVTNLGSARAAASTLYTDTEPSRVHQLAPRTESGNACEDGLILGADGRCRAGSYPVPLLNSCLPCSIPELEPGAGRLIQFILYDFGGTNPIAPDLLHATTTMEVVPGGPDRRTDNNTASRTWDW